MNPPQSLAWLGWEVSRTGTVQLVGQYRTKAAREGPSPLKCVVSKKKKKKCVISNLEIPWHRKTGSPSPVAQEDWAEQAERDVNS